MSTSIILLVPAFFLFFIALLGTLNQGWRFGMMFLVSTGGTILRG
jgi:hypothetical protein